MHKQTTISCPKVDKGFISSNLETYSGAKKEKNLYKKLNGTSVKLSNLKCLLSVYLLFHTKK